MKDLFYFLLIFTFIFLIQPVISKEFSYTIDIKDIENSGETLGDSELEEDFEESESKKEFHLKEKKKHKDKGKHKDKDDERNVQKQPSKEDDEDIILELDEKLL